MTFLRSKNCNSYYNRHPQNKTSTRNSSTPSTSITINLRGNITTDYKVTYPNGVKHISKQRTTCKPNKDEEPTCLFRWYLYPYVHMFRNTPVYGRKDYSFLCPYYTDLVYHTNWNSLTIHIRSHQNGKMSNWSLHPLKIK